MIAGAESEQWVTCIYVLILPHFGDIARYWWKFAILNLRTIWNPHSGCNFTEILGICKLKSMGYRMALFV